MTRKGSKAAFRRKTLSRAIEILNGTAKKKLLDVKTYHQESGATIATFEDLLARPVPLPQHTNANEAYTFADYVRHALAVLQKAVENLVATRNERRGDFRLSDADSTTLRNLRSKWAEHLRAYKYALWHSPPLSGGIAAQYSLAVQIWLLIAHANVVLQQSGSVDTLYEVYPPNSDYLSRNRLVLDNGHIVQYPLRTLLMTLENFVERLDVLDRLHADYMLFTAALEHCVSKFICFTGKAAEFNAAEWCVVCDTPPGQEPSDEPYLRVSEKFLTYTMVWFATIYDYAENWCALTRIDNAPVRMPAHVVRKALWFPRASSMRSQSALLCRYAQDLIDEVWRSSLCDFLRKFQLRPCDLDLYRVVEQMNEADIVSVRTHRFAYRSQIIHAYLYHVHFDRMPYEYVVEALQWHYGDEKNTRSASLGIQWFITQCAILFIWHQFFMDKFPGFEFKHRCVLFHRDPAYISTLLTLRSQTYPVIIQQFARFSVYVPAHGAVHTQERVYDCMDIFEALAVWSVWVMRTCNGIIENNDRKIDLSVFLHTLYGEKQLKRSCTVALE